MTGSGWPLLALAAGSVLLACAAVGRAGAGGPEEPSSGEAFTLAVGEVNRPAGEELTVRFEEVAGDSRCPRGVDCIWAGDAEVVLAVTVGDGESASLTLHTHGGERYPREGEALGRRLRLLALEPYPVEGMRIAPESYRATLLVEAPAEAAEER